MQIISVILLSAQLLMGIKRKREEDANNTGGKMPRLEVVAKEPECMLPWLPTELLVKILEEGDFEGLMPFMCTNLYYSTLLKSSLSQGLIKSFYEHYRSQEHPQRIAALTALSPFVLRYFDLERGAMVAELGRILSLTSAETTVKLVCKFLEGLDDQDRTRFTRSFVDNFVRRGNMDPTDPLLLLRTARNKEELYCIVRPLILAGHDNILAQLIFGYTRDTPALRGDEIKNFWAGIFEIFPGCRTRVLQHLLAVAVGFNMSHGKDFEDRNILEKLLTQSIFAFNLMDTYASEVSLTDALEIHGNRMEVVIEYLFASSKCIIETVPPNHLPHPQFMFHIMISIWPELDKLILGCREMWPNNQDDFDKLAQICRFIDDGETFVLSALDDWQVGILLILAPNFNIDAVGSLWENFCRDGFDGGTLEFITTHVLLQDPVIAEHLVEHIALQLKLFDIPETESIISRFKFVEQLGFLSKSLESCHEETETASSSIFSID